MKFYLLAAVVLAMLVSSQIAFAGVRVPLYGLLDRATYTAGGSKNVGTFGVGGGLGLEFHLTANAGLELGALYLQRKSAVTANYLHVPVLFRIWIKGIFTFGGGLHYSSGLGNLKTSDGSSSDFASSGYDKGDFGAVGVAGFNIPVKGIGFVMEARYVFGLYNVSTVDGVVAKYDDVQVLLGLRFGSFGGPGY